jgi:hypothetical protein
MGDCSSEAEVVSAWLNVLSHRVHFAVRLLVAFRGGQHHLQESLIHVNVSHPEIHKLPYS